MASLPWRQPPVFCGKRSYYNIHICEICDSRDRRLSGYYGSPLSLQENKDPGTLDLFSFSHNHGFFPPGIKPADMDSELIKVSVLGPGSSDSQPNAYVLSA